MTFLRLPSYTTYLTYVMLLLIAAHSVICSPNDFDDLSFFSPINSSYVLEQSTEATELTQLQNSSSLVDECNFCCCQLFIYTDVPSEPNQVIDFPLAETIVSSEQKGYISLPFRPPKLA
ncbi:MAG: hypothetical protein CMK64_00510 [Pseudoalteromonas sp.]|nr:hypothetical protein [Pseudoalteromonas sp.]